MFGYSNTLVYRLGTSGIVSYDCFPDGCGYVEDGRDFFDDDQDGDSAPATSTKGNISTRIALKD